MITKEMSMEQIITEYPDVIPLFFEYGLHCVNCGYAAYDTLEAGCRAHGMDDETIAELLKDLNELITILEKEKINRENTQCPKN